MKNRAIQYLALDVHQKTTVATVREESGSIRMRATVATEGRAIVGLVSGLGSRVHVAFEEGKTKKQSAKKRPALDSHFHRTTLTS